MSDTLRFRDDVSADEPAVSLDAFLEQENAESVRIEAGEDVTVLFPHLDRVRLVEVDFPRFRDGRGFSTARMLREEGYTGEIKATGDVLVDLVLFMRYIHAWMAAGIAEKAFSDAFAALRPGGVLGVEQHRLQPDEDQDPAAANGYVQEAFVKQLAAEAGFVFVEASEINANPKDTKDHPFGADTLAPIRLTAPMGQPANPEFDRTKYDAIGESDRMTLKFRKPE